MVKVTSGDDLRFVLGGCLFQAAMFTAAASAMAVGQDVESGLVDRVRVLPGATGGYVAGRLATDVLRMSASIAALLIGLVIAAVVAYCNATSSARLAAVYPVSGGTYVYGRERLGDFWGYLAGWAFVVGKTASCAAMALTASPQATPEKPQGVSVPRFPGPWMTTAASACRT